MTSRNFSNPELDKTMSNIMEDSRLVNDNVNSSKIDILSADVHNILKETYKNLIIDKRNFFLVVLKTVELVESVGELTGPEKKKVVVTVLKQFIMELNLDDDLEKELLDKSLNSIIETIINASRNKFKFKKQSGKKVEKKTVDIIVNELIVKLIILTNKGDIEPIYIISNIASIVGTLIEVIKNYPYLSKMEQKEVIEQAILQFIRDELPKLVTLSANDKAMLEFARYIVPQVVDGIFAINDSQFFINIKKNKCVRNYLCCCCY